MTATRFSILLLSMACHREMPVQNATPIQAPQSLPSVASPVAGSNSHAPVPPPAAATSTQEPSSTGVGTTILQPADRRTVKIRPLLAALPNAEDRARRLMTFESAVTQVGTCVPEAYISMAPESGTKSLRVLVDGVETPVRNLRKSTRLWTFTVDSACGLEKKKFLIEEIGSSCHCGFDKQRREIRCPCWTAVIQGEVEVRRR